MSLDELLERLEKATEGSRELDIEIYVTEFPFPCVELHPEDQRNHDEEKAPSYTTSIDAALTLVPEGWVWTLNSGKTGSVACLCSDWSDDYAKVYWSNMADESNEGRHYKRRVGATPTPGLALCIASLRARKET